MRRILLLAATLTVALPTAAEASVIPSVSNGTLTVTGDGAADSITLRLVSPTTLDVNGTTFARATFSKIAIRSGAGDDSIRIADALTEAVTIESGPGADTVVGGPGTEAIASGDDADLVHPGAGDDTVQLGAGDDTVIQGDGFDQIDGQAGKDRLQAIGSDDSEEFTLQANGVKARIARDTGPATTDSSGVEALEVIASGGPDLVDIGDLGPTEVLSVETDLGTFDSAGDQIAVQGTDEFDNISVRPFLDDVRVEGLDPTIQIQSARASEDRLTVSGRGGVDFISAGNGTGARIALTFGGGAGTDVLDGSDAADTLLGGPDADVVTGGRGDDVIDLGDGDDRYSHSQPDGRDRIEGGAGADLITAVGGTGDDAIEVRRLLARTRILYGAGGMAELTGVERVDLAPFGGTDDVVVGDLTGTATGTSTCRSTPPTSGSTPSPWAARWRRTRSARPPTARPRRQRAGRDGQPHQPRAR